jgi:hypothetical protein
MPRSVQKVGTLVRTELIVFDDGDNRVTGLVNADFTKRLVKDGVSDPTVVTVSEIDAITRPGEYEATFTPLTIGEWFLYVFESTFNPRGWQEQFDVTVTGPDWGQRVIDGFTVAQTTALMAAANQGKVAGAPLAPVIRAQDDSADRIAATCDLNGDRIAVTLTPPPP